MTEAITPATPTGLPLATIPRRITGFVIDFALIAALLAGVWALEGQGVFGLPYPTAQNVAAPVLAIALLVLVPALTGRTVGMTVLGMQVRGAEDRGRVGFWRMVVRGALTWIDMLLIGLVGVISMAVTPRRQRLGDLVARTVVERTA